MACQVSEAGDLLYVYRPGVRGVLAAKSWRLRAAPVLAQVQRAGGYVVRVAFGATLLASVVLVRARVRNAPPRAANSAHCSHACEP